MDYSTLDDAALLVRVVRADPDALNALYDRYHRLVFSLALQVVFDRVTAEEVTLDVFMRLWQRAETYRPDQGRVSTWLSRITRNRSIDLLRQRQTRPEHESLCWAEHSPSGEGPEETFEQRMRQDRVRMAVAQLPPEQQQVLALAFFRGYTHRQIAELLNQPLGTVKTRLRLAMQKLRQVLAEEIPARG